MSRLSPSLAAYAEDLRTRWGLSALSVSLVDGRSQAFGHPTSGPMTPDTACLITSNTKLFTAVAIGILVDQGKMSFDSKIKDLIPEFRVENEHTTQHVTVADAMSHSTGCASGNICFAFRLDDTHRDIVDNICATRCANELKQTFVYDNRWFSVMAYIIEEISGQTYSEFITSHVLQPLGMSSSTFSTKDAEAKAATPTVTLDDATTMKELPFYYTHAKPGNSWEAAAALFSTSLDMAKWVAFLVKTANGAGAQEHDDDGTAKIVSRETFKQIIKPRAISDMQLWFLGFDRGQAVSPEFSTPLYALGVERFHFHGIDVASHNGCNPGYSSVTLWTPGRDFGVAIVANAAFRGNAVINLIAIRAFEEHFGTAHADWEGRMLAKEASWATGPYKLPSLDNYSGAAVDVADLKGTYTSPGCVSNLHVVGVDDDNLPANVKQLRDHLLKQDVFGRAAGELSLMAIWDSESAYLGSFLNLIHVRENVFVGEEYELCHATAQDQRGVLLVALYGATSRPLFYVMKDSEGRVIMEYKHGWENKVPELAEGQGDFTFVKINSF